MMELEDPPARPHPPPSVVARVLHALRRIFLSEFTSYSQIKLRVYITIATWSAIYFSYVFVYSSGVT